jgi:hypothetical protein
MPESADPDTAPRSGPDRGAGRLGTPFQPVRDLCATVQTEGATTEPYAVCQVTARTGGALSGRERV